MQTVSEGDNLHVMSNLIYWIKKIRKNIVSLSSAEFVLSMLSINGERFFGPYADSKGPDPKH